MGMSRSHPTPRARQRLQAARMHVALGGVLGSAFGFVFGLGALNRPLGNALVFYGLGFVLGAAVGLVLHLMHADGAQTRGRNR
jgi:hypothetical protein